MSPRFVVTSVQYKHIQGTKGHQQQGNTKHGEINETGP